MKKSILLLVILFFSFLSNASNLNLNPDSFIRAAEQGDVKKVDQFLSQGIGLNVLGGPSGHGAEPMTALMAAARGGQFDIVKKLIEKRADVNIVAGLGGTALTYAAISGKSEIIEFLLANGVDLKIDENKAALNEAAEWGQLKIVKILLKQGIDINFRTAFYDTPLINAIKSGHEDVSEYLIGQKADLHTVSHFGFDSPLAIAAGKGLRKTTKLIVSAGATQDEIKGAVRVALKNCQNEILADFISRDPKKRILLLMDAASHGCVGAVKIALDQGISVNVRGPSGDTLLINATYGGSLREPKIQMVSFLLDNFHRKKFLDYLKHPPRQIIEMNIRNFSGKTALDYTQVLSNPEIQKMLIDHGADYGNKVSDEILTPTLNRNPIIGIYNAISLFCTRTGSWIKKIKA